MFLGLPVRGGKLANSPNSPNSPSYWLTEKWKFHVFRHGSCVERPVSALGTWRAVGKFGSLGGPGGPTPLLVLQKAL